MKTDNKPKVYKLEPEVVHGPDYSIYPGLRREEKDGHPIYIVQLQITRKPDQVPLDDLKLVVSDKNGLALPQIQVKKFPEVGGGLGTTTNIAFYFSESDKATSPYSFLLEMKEEKYTFLVRQP